MIASSKKYTPSYFKNTLPEWKRKKDSIVVRLFYRRISFYVSCLAARVGFSANTVSRIGIVISLLTIGMFLVDIFIVRVIAASLLNIWLICDCADGNLARAVKRQHFGGFFDALGSYLLEGFLYVAIGISVFHTGGMFFSASSAHILVAGCLASLFMIFAKLVHQKYTNVKVQIDGYIIPVNSSDIPQDFFGKMRSFMESNLGLAGVLPLSVLIAVILNALDIVVLYVLTYHFAGLLVVLAVYTVRAYRYEKMNVYVKTNAEDEE